MKRIADPQFLHGLNALTQEAQNYRWPFLKFVSFAVIIDFHSDQCYNGKYVFLFCRELSYERSRTDAKAVTNLMGIILRITEGLKREGGGFRSLFEK